MSRYLLQVKTLFGLERGGIPECRGPTVRSRTIGTLDENVQKKVREA